MTRRHWSMQSVEERSVVRSHAQYAFRQEVQPFSRRIASAVGALAVGSLGLGAGAVGALAIGRLAVRRAAIQSLRIEDLEVDRLRVRDLEVVEERRPQGS